MGAEDHRGVVWHLVQLVDADGALGAQRFHHVPVVHDLTAHVDGRAADRQRQLDDVDGALDARAEAARPGQKDLGDRNGAHIDPHGKKKEMPATPTLDSKPRFGWLVLPLETCW